MSTLLLIPLDDTVVFPTMDVTLPVDTHGEERVLLIPRHEGEFAKVGTIARVAQSVRLRIRDDVESGAQKQQREYFLRRQMESIRKELGEDDESVIDDYRNKIEDGGMPDEVREQAERELGRLERMGEQSGEASMIRT